MTLAERNQRVVAELGAGNTVSPREALKIALADLLDALDRHDKGQDQTNLGDPNQIDNVIAGLDAELDAFMAVAFPLVEYGGESGQEAVAGAIARIARETDRDTRTPGWSRAMLVLGARLVWIFTAFALAEDAVDFLPRLRRISTRSSHGDGNESLITSSSARFLDAYNGDAGLSFEAHQRWLEERTWVADRYPLLSRENEFVAFLMEADLVLAIAAALSDGSGAPYCHGAYRDGLPGETRLRAHAADPRHRAILCAFLGIEGVDLEAKVNKIYRGFRRPGMWIDEMNLLPTPQDEQ
jgi:hypothetical protein